MRKRFYIALMISVALACGCSKTDYSPKPAEFETTSATEAETTTEEASSEDAATETAEPEEPVGIVFIPDHYEVFEDGESHYVLYHADEEETRYNNFLNVSRPDLGIDTVSFITAFIAAEGDTLYHPVNNTIEINSEEDARRVYDYTDMEWMDDNGYGRFMPTDGHFGMISCEYEIAGDEPTVEEMEKLGKKYGMISAGDIMICEAQNGEKVYARLAGMSHGGSNGMLYYGVFLVRFKDGMAQGVYYALRDEYGDPRDYLNYVCQSLRFAD